MPLPGAVRFRPAPFRRQHASRLPLQLPMHLGVSPQCGSAEAAPGMARRSTTSGSHSHDLDHHAATSRDMARSANRIHGKSCHDMPGRPSSRDGRVEPSNRSATLPVVPCHTNTHPPTHSPDPDMADDRHTPVERSKPEVRSKPEAAVRNILLLRSAPQPIRASLPKAEWLPAAA